jgi:hypothetical protein
MFFAAFTSRSWVSPQLAHFHDRTSSGILSQTSPQAEQAFELGNQRSILTNALPRSCKSQRRLYPYA